MSRRSRYTGPLLIITGLLFLQCAIFGGGRGKPRSFDLLGFPGDDTVITAHAEPLLDPDAGDEPHAINEPTGAGPEGSNTIYRVQFYATTSLREAEDMQARARRTLSENVSIEFATPYYKLMIGPLSDEDAAQRMLVKLRAMGYDSAWIVRAQSDNQAQDQ